MRSGLIEDVPSDVDMVVDGYMQGTDSDVTVSLNLIDMTNKTNIWSQTFSVQHDEPFELLRQIATSIALFFGANFLAGDITLAAIFVLMGSNYLFKMFVAFADTLPTSPPSNGGLGHEAAFSAPRR